MVARRKLLAAAGLLLAATPHMLGPGRAQTQPVSQTERREILDAARGTAMRDLGKPVRFVVKNLNAENEWAFLYARMVDPNGAPLSYEGTPFAEAAQHGLKSDSYAALLWKSERGWDVLIHVVGPTDVAWQGWGQKFGAPNALFPK